MYMMSTRNKDNTLSCLNSVLKGIASDGGLFVPDSFPSLPPMETLMHKSYPEIAADVLSLFFGNIKDMGELTKSAYASFSAPEVAPIQKIGDHEYVLELFHGPTLAFKDMALQMLPRLMSRAMGEDRKVLILTATSGDTGKAALEGFKDVNGTEIVVFYPDAGVSTMQQLQMITQEGKNVHVAAVRGNFDDAQTGVKNIFGDPEFNKAAEDLGYCLSSANSINFGRLAPQIAYYVYAYAKLVASGEITNGEEVVIDVPTGNFGNILAAYYAKLMGLPVRKLICASNENNVLTDFFDSGHYETHREFKKTISPSMDILVSSNLERLLFEVLDRDPKNVAHLMALLKTDGGYSIPDSVRSKLGEEFYADYADEISTKNTIKETFKSTGYLMDPHTAVAQTVYNRLKARTGDTTPTIVVSTASPYKFSEDVYEILTGEREQNGFAAAEKLAKLAGQEVPKQIASLKTSTVRHRDCIDIDAMSDTILGYLKK